MQRALAFASIPVTFGTGAFAAHVLLARAPRSIAIDRAQPMLVVTAWANYGIEAFAILVATIALASAALAIALRVTDRADARASIGLAPLLAIALASVLACAAWPFAFSSDVFAYAAYGDLALRGTTPYALAPPGTHDALIDAARWQWGGAFPPCVYGPAFVAFAAALVALAHACDASAAGTLWLFRATAIVAYLATIACAHASLRGRSERSRARLLAAGALNPIVVWSVAEGHNDIFALLVIAAIAASGVLRDDRAFALPGIASIVKFSVGLPAVALSLDAIFVRGRSLRNIGLATIVGFAIAASSSVPPLAPALRSIARDGRYAPSVSLPGVLGIAEALAVALACAIAAFAALRLRKRSGHAWLGLAAFACLPNPYPWYGVLFVPLALAAGRSRAGISLYALTIYAVARYLPDASGNTNQNIAAIGSLAMLAPFAFALSGLRADLSHPQKDRTPS